MRRTRGYRRTCFRKPGAWLWCLGLKKVAFIGGGKYGRGYASCMTRKGWSPPAAVRIEGGSFGLQLGGSSTDVIMLVLNEGGMKKLLSDKFTLGGEAAAAAGPVGRNTSANTDVLMKAEILSWSRSQGVFAGLSLEGATLRQDQDENAKLYGKPLTNEEILTGTVKRPATAATFLAQLQRFSGKGVPPAVVPAKSQQRKPVQNNQVTRLPYLPRTVRANQRRTLTIQSTTSPTMPASGTTADQQKNGKSDLQLTASIRQQHCCRQLAFNLRPQRQDRCGEWRGYAQRTGPNARGEVHGSSESCRHRRSGSRSGRDECSPAVI